MEALIDGNCALKGNYESSGGIFLPTFRANMSVPSLIFKLKMG
jgi:hypothetical protein